MEGTEQNGTQFQEPQPQLRTPSRTAIKQWAKQSFKAQYGVCVAIVVIVLAIGAVADPAIWGRDSQAMPILVSGTCFGTLIMFLIVPVVTVGQTWSFLNVYRNKTIRVGDLFIGFRNYGHNLGGMLWAYLFTFLWSCLFIIPGIVKGIAYSFVPYLLQEYPDLAATDAIKVSMAMTKGYKGQIFVMYLSFIGWCLLSVLTLGLLGILYVAPYYMASTAGLYEEYKKLAFETGAVDESRLGTAA